MDEQALRSWLAADDPGELAIPPAMTTTVIDAARATQRRQRRTAVAGAAAAVLVVASAPVALSLNAGSTARRTSRSCWLSVGPGQPVGGRRHLAAGRLAPRGHRR